MNWQVELDALLKRVEVIPTVTASVDALLTGVSKIAGAIAADAAAVKQFADYLQGKTGAASAAVVANTTPKAP